MFTICLAALVGLIDDGLKVFKARNLGLNKRAKIIGLLVVAVVFVVLVINLTHVDGTLSFTRYDYPGLDLGTIGWSILAIFLILAATNSVNLTDGLDGLAAGSSIFAFAAFIVICFVGFRHIDIYGDQSFLDTAVIAAGDARRLRRLPLVERRAGPDLHGRYGLTRDRRCARHPRAEHQHGAALADRRRFVRDGDAVGDHPSGELPVDAASGSSAWHRCIITSSWPAGPRRR